MKKYIPLILLLFVANYSRAQLEPLAGNWKTWFISSGKDWRLPAPPISKTDMQEVLTMQQNLDATGLQQIIYWNTGAPGYRWQQVMSALWTTDFGGNGVLANMLLSVASYDATIAAWNTKYAYKRSRPFTANKRVQLYTVKPESPSYPCEHSVVAGVAVAIIGHFYPTMADSVNKMAVQEMQSRIAAGVAYPSDTRAGFELGKRIAEAEIERTKDFVSKKKWDGKRPGGPNIWKGEDPLLPMAGLGKTVVLDSASQVRPGPPPDFAKDMAEMKKFKRTLRSNVNAYNFASGYGDDELNKKILEYNIHLNPPRAARIYAINAIGLYDGFVACWDAKYTYWGIRPDQYDTSYHALLMTPPFPGYPSGHAMMGSVMAELYSYFFPADSAYFRNRARQGAESRFQGGIHFRTDNEVGMDIGKKVAALVIQRVKRDGVDEENLTKNNSVRKQ